jgi:hypothetical protein
MQIEQFRKSLNGLGFSKIDIENWDSHSYWSGLEEWTAPYPSALILNRKTRDLNDIVKMPKR